MLPLRKAMYIKILYCHFWILTKFLYHNHKHADNSLYDNFYDTIFLYMQKAITIVVKHLIAKFIRVWEDFTKLIRRESDS